MTWIPRRLGCAVARLARKATNSSLVCRAAVRPSTSPVLVLSAAIERQGAVPLQSDDIQRFGLEVRIGGGQAALHAVRLHPCSRHPHVRDPQAFSVGTTRSIHELAGPARDGCITGAGASAPDEHADIDFANWLPAASGLRGGVQSTETRTPRIHRRWTSKRGPVNVIVDTALECGGRNPGRVVAFHRGTRRPAGALGAEESETVHSTAQA